MKAFDFRKKWGGARFKSGPAGGQFTGMVTETLIVTARVFSGNPSVLVPASCSNTTYTAVSGSVDLSAIGPGCC